MPIISLRRRDVRNLGGGNIQWPDYHDAIELVITVDILVDRCVDNDLALIIGGVHEVQYAGPVTLCESDMLCKSLWSSPRNTNDIAAPDLGLDIRDREQGTNLNFYRCEVERMTPAVEQRVILVLPLHPG